MGPPDISEEVRSRLALALDVDDLVEAEAPTISTERIDAAKHRAHRCGKTRSDSS